MLFETPRFAVEIGTLQNDPEPQYLVRNKATNVIEFCNASLYFAKDWALQFTEALDKQDQDLKDRENNKLMAAVETPNGSLN